MLSRVVMAHRMAARSAHPPPTVTPAPKSFLTPEKSLHTSTTPETQLMRGEVYQKSPAKLRMEAGKTYYWCACGLSGKQPLCDGSHKRSSKGIKPLPFIPASTQEYALCNCKQSDQSPLCDSIQCKK